MTESGKKIDESWKDQIEEEKKQAHVEEKGKDVPREEDAAQTKFPPMQANFATLIADLAMQASFFMGEIPNPETDEPAEDLNRAKYLIDQLGALEKKTAGNLTPDEEGSLKNVLYELRMKYVSKAPKP